MAVNRFFGIGTGEPTTPTAASGYRCYYELPNDASMGYIWAADSNDVRSEGMSYGMMIAVQMDLHEQFDRLWKFAKTYMQYPASGGAWSYYFKWQGTVYRQQPSPSATPALRPTATSTSPPRCTSPTSAGASTGAFNYKQEADNIATAMLHNTATGDGTRSDHQRRRQHGRLLSPGRLRQLHRPELPPAGLLRAVRPLRPVERRGEVAIDRHHQPQLPGHLGPRHDGPAPGLRDLPGHADDGDAGRRSQRVPLRRLARGHEHGGRLRLVQRQRAR